MIKHQSLPAMFKLCLLIDELTFDKTLGLINQLINKGTLLSSHELISLLYYKGTYV